MSAELDPVTGSVVLPFDRFTGGYEEMDLLSTADTAMNTVCAREQGVEAIALKPTYDPVYDSESFFGPWTVDQAERFGFVTPMTDADLRANGYVPQDYGEPPSEDRARALEIMARATDDDFAVFATCRERPESKQFDLYLPAQGPWNARLDAVSGGIDDDPAVRAVFDELGQCLQDNGLEPDPELPWQPVGADQRVINEEQVAMALTVVECKTSIDATRRIADRWAALQAPILDEYASELLDEQAVIDEALATAREYIGAHPEAFEPQR